ncbi:hypothetical protein CONPUDRAFT_166865 [Coniophora puteana RWD-64-598 SS2]|uniref:Uncharacterized protein n=1 Tax=Coniophora puteana (strain RWD-64-598) TaxID=741705 RepID=A0A5M3MIG0_CONPW|nr:uncharacterized protein CONPUDRAFT_166865 [Coniophora puteana RWD-64-598 SS2]EIW79028.1 hypothetical protein CONPUDRAFT_166865 [Coniophora puteana RWD-64-598 SS2]
MDFLYGSITSNQFAWALAPKAIPPQDVTDHISGRTFFIRSKADPRDFWHVPREGTYAGKLRVSRDNRTRFRIAAKHARAPLNGGPIVMIGSDAIDIAEARTGSLVVIDSSGYLSLGAPAGLSAAMAQLVVEERAEEAEPLVVEERGEDTVPGIETHAQIFFKDLKSRFAVVPEEADSVIPRTRRLETECATYSISRSIESASIGTVIWSVEGSDGSHSRPIIPPQDAVTDHISGNSFFIRSKADSRHFWHIPRRGRYAGILLVSRTDRTRFRVTSKDAPAPLNCGPTVMIGSDAVEIAEARTGRVVGIDNNGYLSLGAPASALTSLVVEERGEVTQQEQLVVVEERGDSTDVPAAEALPEVPDGSPSVTRRLEVGDGEEWELV